MERLFHKNKILTSRLLSQHSENRGRLHSCLWISLVSRLLSCDLTSFGKKPYHKEHWNQSYSRVRHLQSQQHSHSCSYSRLHICVYPRNQSHSRSQVNQRDWLRRNWLCGQDDLLARMTYQARRANPSKKLTGKNIQDYNPWAHSIWRKLKVNTILFLTNPDKTDYVLLQMKASIWDKINTWIIIQGDLLTKYLLKLKTIWI